jgi:hypothetical protein
LQQDINNILTLKSNYINIINKDNIFISNYINIINKDNIFISNIYKNIIYFILFINAIRFLKAKRKGLQIA